MTPRTRRDCSGDANSASRPAGERSAPIRREQRFRDGLTVHAERPDMMPRADLPRLGHEVGDDHRSCNQAVTSSSTRPARPQAIPSATSHRPAIQPGRVELNSGTASGAKARQASRPARQSERRKAGGQSQGSGLMAASVARMSRGRQEPGGKAASPSRTAAA